MVNIGERFIKVFNRLKSEFRTGISVITEESNIVSHDFVPSSKGSSLVEARPAI